MNAAMTFEVLTIFPEIIRSYISESIIKRALQRGIIEVDIYNIRDFTVDRHHKVDDYPYGGGAGMVLKPDPIFNTIDHIRKDNKERRIILLSPGGRIFTQKIAGEYALRGERLLMIAGRYEGVDERIKDLIDEELSIGDYILTGGELPSLVIIDAIARLLPGVLGDETSPDEESFSDGLLEYPQYTRPSVFRGMEVPGVLLSGDHEKVRRWRRKEALRLTLSKRPDLLVRVRLSNEDKTLLKEIKEKQDESYKGG